MVCVPSKYIKQYLYSNYEYLQNKNNIEYLNNLFISDKNINAEYFCEIVINSYNWNVGKIQNNSFISADKPNEITTWGIVNYDEEKKVFFKYKEQFDMAYNRLKEYNDGSNWTYIVENNIDKIILIK